MRESSGERHRAEDPGDDGQGQACPRRCDAVDPQEPHRDQFAEDDPIRLHRDEGQKGAEEDPSPEAKHGARAGRIPVEAVADPRQEGVAHGQPYEVVDDAPGDERPDGPRGPRPPDHHHQAGGLRDQIDDGETTEEDRPRRGEEPGGVESRNQRGERRRGDQVGELRLVIEGGDRACQQEGHGTQNKFPADLDGPRGVEVARIVAALVLDDARADADVREHGQPREAHTDEGHHPEGFRVEQSPENQVVEQAQKLAAPVADQGPHRAPGDPRAQSARA